MNIRSAGLRPTRERPPSPPRPRSRAAVNGQDRSALYPRPPGDRFSGLLSGFGVQCPATERQCVLEGIEVLRALARRPAAPYHGVLALRIQRSEVRLL